MPFSLGIQGAIAHLQPPGGGPSGVEEGGIHLAEQLDGTLFHLLSGHRWQRQDWLMALVPRSWVQMVWNPNHLEVATATHRHRPPSHIFYTSLQSPTGLKNSDSCEKNKPIDGLWKTMKGMGTTQWTLTGVKPPVVVGFFQPFTSAPVFTNSFVPICGIAQRGQDLIKYYKSKAHPDQGEPTGLQKLKHHC